MNQEEKGPDLLAAFRHLGVQANTIQTHQSGMLSKVASASAYAIAEFVAYAVAALSMLMTVGVIIPALGTLLFVNEAVERGLKIDSPVEPIYFMSISFLLLGCVAMFAFGLVLRRLRKRTALLQEVLGTFEETTDGIDRSLKGDDGTRKVEDPS